VKVLAFHDNSACGYHRIRQPLGELAKHGHDVRVVYGNADPDPDTDVVVGERLDHPDVLGTWRRWKPRHRLVYEVDDDVYSVDRANWLAHRVYRWQVPVEVTRHVAQVADLVTCSTPYLAEVQARETGHANIVVLPNYLDEAVFDVVRPRRERLVVGWAGGASYLREVSMIARPLARFFARNPHAEFHMVGQDFRGVLPFACRWTDWLPDVLDYYRALDFDIAVAPVADTEFNRSRSNVKVLAYAALGIPVVASDAECFRDFVLDGVTGFLVRREHEWGRRLYQLASDAAMRAEMGAKAREHARGWTIQANWWRWEQAYQSILQGGPR
jgi:glycosyltransferase involved in cell wall biosynthesis